MQRQSKSADTRTELTRMDQASVIHTVYWMRHAPMVSSVSEMESMDGPIERRDVAFRLAEMEGAGECDDEGVEIVVAVLGVCGRCCKTCED